MKNDTCIECGKKFEPREGKLYCSDSCKQSAWNKKQKAPKDFEEGEVQSYETKKKILYQFEKKEFLKVQEDYDSDLNIIEYCFMRKNMTGNPTVKEIVEYIKNLNFQFALEENPGYKSFQEFIQKFQDGLIVVNYNNPIPDESHTIEPAIENTES